MTCPICHASIEYLTRVIEGKKIYECNRCQLAIIPQQKKTLKKLYSFKNYKTQEKYLEKRLRSLAKIVTRFVNHGKLLDVGAGFGQFSSILSRTGNFHVELVEPIVPPKYLMNKNKVVYKMNYEDFVAGHPKGVRDLILMMDVLEHFNDPIKNLIETKKILSKNGCLIIQTPNYKSLMARICQKWSWWMLEDHKFIFSPKSIRKIIKISGYKIIYFKTYEDLYDFKKNLDGNFYNKFVKAIFYLIFFPFYLIFRKIIWHLNYGGAIFLIVRQYNR